LLLSVLIKTKKEQNKKQNNYLKIIMRSIFGPKDDHDKAKPQQKYPEFVAYHFLNALGELLAIEEDGNNTENFLKEGGLSVDGSSIKGMLSVEKSDLCLVPEEESFLSIRIDNLDHHRFLAHLVDKTGRPHPRDPRGVLKKLVDEANEMGFEPYMFSEVEFYIINQDGTPADDAGYCSLPPQDRCYEFRHQLGKICKAAGMAVKRIHHENGPGQNEIELNLTPCMKNADDTILCMWILDMLAAQRDQKIIFSPKPFETEAGSGLHHHILLRDIKTGENVFMNPTLKGVTEVPSDDLDRLSETCRHGIAGLLKYADEITAVFAASNESFVRLQPGFEAPSLTTWDFSNRTALVRVPQTSNEAVRFEYRGGDLSGSVHLFGSVLLAAVLKGIKEKLELPTNTECNVEMLSQQELEELGIRSVPTKLEQCLEVLKTSDFLKEALGPEMVEVLIHRDEELLARCK
jgi:glutamine synthetase